MKTLSTFLLFGVFLIAGGSASAGLIITGGTGDIVEGGTGRLDFMVETDNVQGETLAGFTLQFKIVAPGDRRLEFIDPQSDSQLASTDYVFRGFTSLPSPLGLIFDGDGGPRTGYIGGDGTLEPSGAWLEFGKKYLLVSLDLTALTIPAPITGDAFEVVLDASKTSFFDDEFAAIEFRGSDGLVTIVSATVVPEPSALAGLIISGPILAIFFAARRRRRLLGQPRVESY